MGEEFSGTPDSDWSTTVQQLYTGVPARRRTWRPGARLPSPVRHGGFAVLTVVGYPPSGSPCLCGSDDQSQVGEICLALCISYLQPYWVPYSRLSREPVHRL